MSGRPEGLHDILTDESKADRVAANGRPLGAEAWAVSSALGRAPSGLFADGSRARMLAFDSSADGDEWQA